MKLKTYPKYKHSGIQWIGEIPEGWEVDKVKHYKKDVKFSIVDGPFGTQLHSEEYVDEGIPVVRVTNLTYNGDFFSENMVFIREEKYSELKRSSIKEGDILIAKTGATIGKIGVFSGFKKAIISSSCLKLSLKDKINHGFFKYLLISDSGQSQILSEAAGSTRDTININPFSNLYFPVPNKIEEQQKIAFFLDKKTSKINALIKKDKKLIGLLKEKRTALINHAVTKGLDPNVKMKDSGVEWIGEIPEGWEVKKLKFVSEVYISNVDKKTYPNEHDVLLCNYIDVYKNEFITSNLEFMKATANIVQVKKLSINKNDVIITKDSETIEEIAIPAIVTEDFQNVVCGYHLAIIRSCKKEILGKYLFRLFQSKKFSEQFSVKANGVTRYGISTYPIKNIPILLPPKKEQAQIVNHLDKHTTRIDKTIQKIEQKIKFLEEYKKSLIHHAVTGKIDIREVKI